ncbi:hypothetical protein [Enterocloster clostridioformis]|nr:hypothetical protein [Enterocloster clostridioformis]
MEGYGKVMETVDIMESSYESVNPGKALTEFSLELLRGSLSHTIV